MQTNNFRRLWGVPLLLVIIIVFGLLSALLGTGVWHVLSWIALCIPIVIIIVCLVKVPANKSDGNNN